VSFGHPSKFQWVSPLRFLTAPASLNGGQPSCAPRLAVSWAGTLCIHFRGLLLPNGILRGAKFSLALSYIDSAAASLHGTQAMGVSKTLQRGIFARWGGHPGRHWTVEQSSYVPPPLCNRAGHHIFALWFLSSSFFPRLISAATDWMSTIFLHTHGVALVRI